MKEKQALLRVIAGGFIGNLFLLGAWFSVYFFFIKPTSFSLADTTKKLEYLEKRETFLRDSEHEIEKRGNDLSALNAAFLNLENAVPFVTLLETTAAKNGVTISIQANSIADPAAAKQAKFTVTATGSLAQLMQFIKQTELMPYFANISSLEISAKNERAQAIMRLSVLTL